MQKTLYIVRHCQAVGQEANAPLTSEGNLQAIALANLLFGFGIERVISSPFIRAYQSIAPLAERLGLSIEIDNRLTERVLCATLLDDWRERLAESFTNLDLYLDGGESSRGAMARGIANKSLTHSIICILPDVGRVKSNYDIVFWNSHRR